VPDPPRFGTPGGQSVRQMLTQGPQSFRDLMEATGSRDGRDVVLALDAIRDDGGLERLPDGRYRLPAQPP
jgi:2,5-furandicarboxylate decarboxylase 1